jgi:hypothetical protein
VRRLLILTAVLALVCVPAAQAKYQRVDLSRIVDTPVYCADRSEYPAVSYWNGLYFPARHEIWLSAAVCSSISYTTFKICHRLWEEAVWVLGHEYTHSLGVFDEETADKGGEYFQPWLESALVKTYTRRRH